MRYSLVAKLYLVQNDSTDSRAKKIEKIFHDFHVIKRAFAESNRLSNQHYGITVTQASVLMVLMHEGRKTMGEMTSILGVSKGATTQLLDSLIDDKLVHRTPDDNDRRVIYVELSLKGEEYLGMVRRSIAQRVADLFDDLDNEELDQTERIMEKLISKVKANK